MSQSLTSLVAGRDGLAASLGQGHIEPLPGHHVSSDTGTRSLLATTVVYVYSFY